MIGCSVVLCTYNGAKKINSTLEFLKNQKVSFPWELLIIDNNSSDNTKNLASASLQNSSIDFQIVKCPIPGKMNAFWKGIEMAKYDFVLDCDDDNHLFDNYIETGLSYLIENSDVGVLGGEGIPKAENFPEWFQTYKKSYAVGPQGISGQKISGQSFLYGAGCFYKKSILMNLLKNKFDFLLTCRIGEKLSSGGDVELCYLISLSGYKIVFIEDLKFYHELLSNRLNWDYYLKLKEGIASSFPLLLSYEALFSGIKEEKEFKGYLRKKFILALKGYVLTSARSLVNPKSRINQVQMIETKTKVLSYFRNRNKTKEAFKSLRKIFK